MKYNELLTLGKERRTAKQYNPHKDISLEDLNKIFEFTNTSPQSMGLNLWRAINIRRNSEHKNPISILFKDMNMERVSMASDLILLVTKKQNYFNYDNNELREDAKRVVTFNKKSSGSDYEPDDEEGYFKAAIGSHFKSECNEKEEWSSRQAYIASGYISLAAKSLNIDSTIMEGFKDEINNYLIENNLISNQEKVTLAVALGYTDGLDRKPFIGKEQLRDQISKVFKII